MARGRDRDPSITQSNDASCIGNKRGMAHKAKTHSNKKDRQRLKKELEEYDNSIRIFHSSATLEQLAEWDAIIKS
jgi:hypothetical protein